MIESLSKVWNFSKKRQKSLVQALILSFVEGLFMMLKMFAVIYAVYTLFGNYSIKYGVTAVLIMTIVCIAGVFLSSYKMQITSVEAGYGMVGDKRIFFGGLLKNVHLGFFSDASVGHINAVLTTTLSGIEAAAPVALIHIAGGVLGSVSVLLGLFFYEWRIALVTLAGMIVYFIVVNWQIKISRRDAPARQKAQSELATATISFLQGIKVTKAFSFKNGDKRLKEAIKESCSQNIQLSNGSLPSQISAQLSIAVFEFAILFTALLGFVKWDIFSAEKAIVLVIMSFMVYASMNQAGSMLSMVGVLDSALKETEELENTEQVTCMKPKEHINSNEIVFENVTFAYGENEVLHDVSTTIKPNSTTAIIGPSGSGKSTFCQLIPRFFDVTKGRITIGGADIRHVETQELMSKISMVFQRVYLFEDTILNNIKFAKPEATFEEVRAAAKAARCDEFIMSLEQGYDTMISEGGGSLSGGEKQRISIARAILKDAPIIILDEATSALDTENEHDVLAAIDELTKNKTVVMIAHRMKSIQNANHIIAIENGEIKQEGTHEELMNQEGIYSRFVNERKKAEGWKVR